MTRNRILLPLLLLGMALGYGCQAQQDTHNPGTTVSSGTAAAPSPAAAVEVVNVDAASKMIASDANLQVLDVRTPEEVAAGTIAGAKVANWFDGDFAQKAESMLDKSKPVLVYCKVGGRSGKAAEVLLGKGYQVYNLEGGITAWNSAGKPLQK